MWVRPTSVPHPSYVLYAGDSIIGGMGLTIGTNDLPQTYATISIGGREEPATGNSTRVPLNTWTHLAVVKSGSLWLLYKNGTLIGRGLYLPDSIPSSLLIGKGFVGEICELRLWDRAISDSEINARMFRSVPTGVAGLIGYFATDQDVVGSRSTVPNHASGLPDLRSITPGATIPVLASDFRYVEMDRPSFQLTSFPKHMQFFPRDKNWLGTVTVGGAITTPGFDSILLQVFRDDSLIATHSVRAEYSANGAPFQFTQLIVSGLTQYTIRLFASIGDTSILLAEGADLVAGDAYFINGQSNAHPAISGLEGQNIFARTFGVLTPNWNLTVYDPADTFWGLANGSGWGEWFTGPYLSGAWGYGVQNRIANACHIPTCIINGGAGVTAIADHYRNDSDPTDLTTVYGRALYRLSKSSLLRHLRVIFWYQGEYDSGASYYGKFLRLYNEWKEDIPYDDSSVAPRTIYLFQIRPGCEIADGALREVQRTTQDSLRGVKVISTTAIVYHDGCHYAWYGYWNMSDKIFAILSRDYYGGTDTAFLNPPNVAVVRYDDSLNRSIRVQFRERDSGLSITPDSITGGKLRRMKDAIYLDGSSAMTDSTIARNGEVIIYLNQSTSAHRLTYLPDKYYTGDSIIYEGPWIINRRDIGALTFDGVPILPYQPDTPGGVGERTNGTSNRITYFGLQQQNGIDEVGIETEGAVAATITIYDILGRQVQSTEVACSPNVKQFVSLPRAGTLAPSLYIAVARTSDDSRSIQFLLP